MQGAVMETLVWWEKTIEYAFLARVVKQISGTFVGPLDGNAEQAADTIFKTGNRWVIIEFKRGEGDLASEKSKFSAKAEAVIDLRKKINATRKVKAVHQALLDESEKRKHDAEINKNKEDLRLACEKLADLQQTMDGIQESAYQCAARHLMNTSGKFHFLVYGKRVKPDAADTPSIKALVLWQRPYFYEANDALIIDKATDILPSKGNDKVGLDGPVMKAYLLDLMSFKNVGLPADEQGGDTSNNSFSKASACLACIDGSGNFVALPMDGVCEVLLAPAKNLQAENKTGAKPK